MKRSRGRGRRQSNPANRSYDSNGPDVRVRGTANQVFEKYQTLARDAQSSGDRIAAENYLQHAEHYYRIMLANQMVRPEASDGSDHDTDTSSDLLDNDAETDASEADVESGDDHVEPLVLRRNGGAHDASDSEDGSDDALVGSDETSSQKGKSSARSSGRRRGPLRSKSKKSDESDAQETSLENAVGE